jgi:hypothetical protein
MQKKCDGDCSLCSYLDRGFLEDDSICTYPDNEDEPSDEDMEE